MIFLHKKINVFFDLLLFNGNHSYGTDSFFPHIFHGIYGVSVAYMRNFTEDDRTAQAVHLFFCTLDALQNALHKRCLRSLEDHPYLDIIFAHRESTAELVRLVPHLLRNLSDVLSYLRLNSAPVIKRPVHSSP